MASDTSSAIDVNDHRKLFDDELAQRTDQLNEIKKALRSELEDKRVSVTNN